MTNPQDPDSPAASAPPEGIGWVDLTVDNAEQLRDFYGAITGLSPSPVDMKDGDSTYQDYCLNDRNGHPVVGVCHRRGTNSALPPQWIIYFHTENLDQKLIDVAAAGGRVLVPAKTMGGHGRYAIIQDPAGASCALFEAAR